MLSQNFFESNHINFLRTHNIVTKKIQWSGLKKIFSEDPKKLNCPEFFLKIWNNEIERFGETLVMPQIYNSRIERSMF
jgi:hypothetical protein